jgi:hypothetical protein
MSAKTYTFKIKDVEYSIPLLNKIPVGVIAKTRNITDEMDKAFTILEIVLEKDNKALEAIYTLDVEEFAEWQKGWIGDVSLGESSGS